LSRAAPRRAATGRTTSRPASRPTEATRRALVEAGTGVFAERGFAGGSVRLITAKARANQAAITYHFGGKEGLYREVLIAARDAFDSQGILDEEGARTLPPEEALRLFLRQYLLPLVRRDQFSRYLRIFAWETLAPTAVALKLAAERPFPLLVLAGHIVRRFLPAGTPDRDMMIAALWLANQPVAFVRNAEFLSREPFGLRFDAASIDALVETLARLSLAGLAGRT
jgi:AcrR family transcriptional regulator